MAKRIGQGQHILLTGPKGDVFHLDEGDKVPDWAKDKLGDHVYQDVDDDGQGDDELEDIDPSGSADDGDEDDEDDDEDEDEDGDEDGDGSDADGETPPPPKSGKGSGKEAWHAYAAAKGIEFEASTSAKDIIAGLDAGGVPTE